MKTFLTPKNLIRLFKEHLSFRAFVFLLFIGIAIAASQIYRSYVINVRYSNPSPLMSSRTMFEYTAFSIIAFIFPWSWKRVKNNKWTRILIVSLTGLGFIFVYLFILSLMEWSASRRDYNLWNGYIFTLYHSGFLSIIIYSLIAGILFFFGITKEKTKSGYLKNFNVRENNKNTIIPVAEIYLIEANDNYVSLYSLDNQHHLVRQTLRKLEKELDPQIFQRIHRKYIVNLNKISSWKAYPHGGYEIYLPHQRKVKMSKSYKEKLKLLKQTG